MGTMLILHTPGVVWWSLCKWSKNFSCLYL